MNNSTLIILNPAAHSERAQRKRAEVEALTRDCAFCTTTRTGDAESMARRAAEEGFQKIVAAGGDGTINEVVNGLAGTKTTLGVLPIGTMNVFATELGLPVNDLGLCWQIIQRDGTRDVDLPKPVLRGHITLREHRVFQAAGADVRHALRITQYIDRGLESGDFEVAV